MPRPRSKIELLEACSLSFAALLDQVNSLGSTHVYKDFNRPGLNKNVRDVLAHLHHWHLLFLSWYDVGMKGTQPEMPEKGYKWSDVPVLNKKIWELYQERSLGDVRKLLEQSHAEIYKIIKAHSNEELFEKKKYKWTGATSLGSYLISTSSSHYNWAAKYIKKSMKI